MRLAALAGAAVLLVGAVVVHQTTPTVEEQNAPFVTTAEVGEWAEGRTFGVRVEGVGLARELAGGDWSGTTDGVWVVATVTAEAAQEPGTLAGSLTIGDLHFDASERAGSSALTGVPLSPGLAQRGDLVFEVPADVLRKDGDGARLRLATRRDPLLDSVVEVRVDLAVLEPVARQSLAVVERSER